MHMFMQVGILLCGYILECVCFLLNGSSHQKSWDQHEEISTSMRICIWRARQLFLL